MNCSSIPFWNNLVALSEWLVLYPVTPACLHILLTGVAKVLCPTGTFEYQIFVLTLQNGVK